MSASRPVPSDYLVYLLLAFACLFWAGNAIVGQLAVGEITPMSLTSLRWLLVTVFFLVFYWRRIGARLDLLWRYRWFFLITGSAGYTAFNFLYYTAAHYTSAMHMLIIQGSLPLFVLAAAAIRYRRRITLIQLAGVALTFFGVLYLATEGHPARLFELGFNRGDLMMLVACAIQTAYFMLIDRKPPLENPVLFCGIACAAFLTSLPLLAAEMLTGNFALPTMTGLWLLAYVAIFPSTLSQILFIISIARIGPGRTGFFNNLVPVFGAGMAVAMLGESFQAYHAIALVSVLASIVLIELNKKQV